MTPLIVRFPTDEDIPQLIKLFLHHKSVSSDCTILPFDERMNDILTNAMKHLVEHGEGVVVTNEDVIIGYMIGYYTGPLFGRNLGFYVPILGIAMDFFHPHLFLDMYNRLTSLTMTKHVYSQAFTIFDNDPHLLEVLFDMGFGKRCVDAIAEVEELRIINDQVQIIKMDIEQIYEIKELHQAHNIFYRQSPIFMPNPDEDALEDLAQWITQDNHHLWMAKIDDQVVGYIRIEPNGECFISHHPSIMNVTGLFVDPDYRKIGVAHELLREVIRWAKDHQYPLLGVDYESINPYANQFWSRYFEPYTMTLTRRIDERIEEYAEMDEIRAFEQYNAFKH